MKIIKFIGQIRTKERSFITTGPGEMTRSITRGPSIWMQIFIQLIHLNVYYCYRY